MTAAVLEVADLDVTIGDRRVVTDLGFSIAAGGTLALIGESGSGKSMTAAAILGLLPLGAKIGARSRLWLDGVRLDPEDDRAMRALRGRDISIVFQDPMSCLNPFMTVGSQIDEALGRLGLRPAARRARLLELLAIVELPASDATSRRYPHELSGGQQQRIMLAMALAAEPKLLIADEPTSALDATVQADILALLKRLQAKLHNAMIFITHDLAVAADIARQVVVMRNGQAVEQGSIAEIFARPQQHYTRELVGARRMLGTVPASPAILKHAPPVLECRDLVYDYPTRRLLSRPYPALDRISLRIARGETLGILGESGCGKSTLTRLAAGLARPTSGTVLLFGQPIAGRLDRALRKRCQIIFQNPYGALNPRLSIATTMQEPLQLLGLSGPGNRERIESVFSELSLDPQLLARYPHELSGGQRQRVCIARALMSRPELLICDEIVSALDMTVQMQVLRQLKALQTREGFGMLFVTHDIAIARWVSDRIAVMHRGEIIEEDTASSIVGRPNKQYTKTLVASMLPHFFAPAPDRNGPDQAKLTLAPTIAAAPVQQ